MLTRWLKLFATPVPGKLMPSSGLHGQYTHRVHVRCTCMYIKQHTQKNKTSKQAKVLRARETVWTAKDNFTLTGPQTLTQPLSACVDCFLTFCVTGFTISGVKNIRGRLEERAKEDVYSLIFLSYKNLLFCFVRCFQVLL